MFKSHAQRSRRLRLKKQRLAKNNTPAPKTRFIYTIDFIDAGSTWELAHEYIHLTPLKGYCVESSCGIRLNEIGEVIIPKGFLFNASGPTIDTEDAVRAACVHDALYVLRDYDFLKKSDRKIVDRLFYDMLIEDGMPKFRAWYWYRFVRAFGWYSWN